jgi:hypothetical protein
MDNEKILKAADKVLEALDKMTDDELIQNLELCNEVIYYAINGMRNNE